MVIGRPLRRAFVVHGLTSSGRLLPGAAAELGDHGRHDGGVLDRLGELLGFAAPLDLRVDPLALLACHDAWAATWERCTQASRSAGVNSSLLRLSRVWAIVPSLARRRRYSSLTSSW
jgi:hypothetical protein